MFLCVLFFGLLPFPYQQKPSRTPPAAPQPDAIELSADPAFHQTFSSDRVKVYRLDLDPHAATELDRHDRDYLLLGITSSHIQATDGKHTNELNMDPEAMQVMKGGWPHRLVNQGDTPASVVVIIPSAKLDPEHAICGLGARECRGGEIGDELGKYTESILFETPAAKLTQAEVAPGAQIPPTEYVNPVLVVANTELSLDDIRKPSENDTTPKDEAHSAKTISLQLKPGDTAYLPGDTIDALKNTGKDDARFVLVTLRPVE